MKIQFRRCPLLDECWVILGKSGDKYECYCLNDDCHFDSIKDFVTRKTYPITDKNTIAILTGMIQNRYSDIEVVTNLKLIK